MEDNTNKIPPATGAAPGQENQSVDNISARLGQEGAAAQDTRTDQQPQPSVPAPLDISQLRPEQIQQLKEMLSITPERANKIKANPRVSIRRYRGVDGQAEPKLIVDIGRAYSTLVKDEHTNITEEVIRIPVKFLGDADFTLIRYKDFMNSEQVVCEVVAFDRQQEWVVEDAGRPVRNRETNELVERGYFEVKEMFTIKLPEGSNPEQVTIEGYMANA